MRLLTLSVGWLKKTICKSLKPIKHLLNIQVFFIPSEATKLQNSS